MDATNGTTPGERVRARYRAALARGELQPDPAQAGLTARLAALADALDGYAPPVSRARWRARWRSRASRPAPPSGLYIHGPVGRGKSMLMDLFFGAIAIPAKRRVHFHAFMIEVHAHLNAQRRDGAAQEPLAALAGRLIERAWLLCFGEFQVQDIADAMILGRLFEALIERGLVVVATSNFAPERLYEGGLNRERFVRFVELLRERVAVVPLAGATDYRLERLREVATCHQSLSPATDARLDQAFAALTDAAAGAPEVIEVASRRLEVPKAARGVAWFDFQAPCEEPLGAADYLALTERYHTVLLSGVPRLTPDKRNQARRFITLVDALYDRRVNLIIGAAAAPDELYPAGDGAFEFQRTVSRLMEMRSRAYFESAPVAGVATASFTPFALTTDIV